MSSQRHEPAATNSNNNTDYDGNGSQPRQKNSFFRFGRDRPKLQVETGRASSNESSESDYSTERNESVASTGWDARSAGPRSTTSAALSRASNFLAALTDRSPGSPVANSVTSGASGSAFPSENAASAGTLMSESGFNGSYASAISIVGAPQSGKSTFRTALGKVASRNRGSAEGDDNGTHRCTYQYKSMGKRKETLQLHVIEDGGGITLNSGLHMYAVPHCGTAVICFPLTNVKQRKVSLAKKIFSFRSSDDKNDKDGPAVMIHSQDVHQLWDMISLVSSSAASLRERPLNLVVLCTFQDMLSENSPSAVQQVLAYVRLLCMDMLEAIYAYQPLQSSASEGSGTRAQSRPTSLRRGNEGRTDVPQIPSLLGVFASNGKNDTCVSENQGGPTSPAEIWSFICDVAMKDALSWKNARERNGETPECPFTLGEYKGAFAKFQMTPGCADNAASTTETASSPAPGGYSSGSSSMARSRWDAAIAESQSPTGDASECGVNEYGDTLPPVAPVSMHDVDRISGFLFAFIRRAKHDRKMLIIPTSRLVKSAFSVGLASRAHLDAVLEFMEREGELLYFRQHKKRYSRHESCVCLAPRAVARAMWYVTQTRNACLATSPAERARSLPSQVRISAIENGDHDKLLVKGVLSTHLAHTLGAACLKSYLPKRSSSELGAAFIRILLLADFMFSRNRWGANTTSFSGDNGTGNNNNNGGTGQGGNHSGVYQQSLTHSMTSASLGTPFALGRDGDVAASANSQLAHDTAEPWSTGSSSRTFMTHSPASLLSPTSHNAGGSGQSHAKNAKNQQQQQQQQRAGGASSPSTAVFHSAVSDTNSALAKTHTTAWGEKREALHSDDGASVSEQDSDLFDGRSTSTSTGFFGSVFDVSTQATRQQSGAAEEESSVEFIIPSVVHIDCSQSIIDSLRDHHLSLSRHPRSGKASLDSSATTDKLQDYNNSGCSAHRIIDLSASPPDLIPVLTCCLHRYLVPDAPLLRQALWLQNLPSQSSTLQQNALISRPASIQRACVLLRTSAAPPQTHTPQEKGPAKGEGKNSSSAKQQPNQPPVLRYKTTLECFFLCESEKDILTFSLFVSDVIDVIRYTLDHRYTLLRHSLHDGTPTQRTPNALNNTSGDSDVDKYASHSSFSTRNALLTLDAHFQLLR